MKHRFAVCAGMAALGVACATSAPAQVYPESPGGYAEPPPAERSMVRPMFQPRLAPDEVLMIVRASGLRPLTQPAVRGSNYVLLASDNMGGQLRVMINGNNGRIMNAAPAHDPRFAYHPVRPRALVPGVPQHQAAAPPSSYVPPPPNLKEASPPPARIARTAPGSQMPPATSSNQSLASAPDITGAVPSRPARTPLPRPRPPEASQQAAAAAASPQATTTAAPRETSPEAEQPAATPPPAAASTAPARPATETQMVPVAPLE